MTSEMMDKAAGPITPASSLRKRLAILCALAGLLVLFWLAADAYLLVKNQGIDLIEPGSCDLREGPCSAQRGEQQIHFSLASEDFSTHAPFNLRVDLREIEAERVIVDLQGRDMYMGLNRVELDRQADGSFAATTQLPVCTTGEMVWRAQVIINPDQAPMGSWFDFKAH